MVRIQAGALALLAGLAVGGCGDGDDRSPTDALPAVTDGGRVDAPDVAAADRLCRRFQRAAPSGVRELRVHVPGSPSVTCVVR